MTRDTLRTVSSPAALPESEGAAATDPRVVRAEERRAMLREPAELGMALTRELTRRTLETAETPEVVPAVEESIYKSDSYLRSALEPSA